jgi:GT2 family glycosyltransferase
VSSFDIVIATHNRSKLLRLTLESLRHLRCPESVRVHIVIVGNACTDDSEQVVESFTGSAPWPVSYLTESQPGKSFALNSAIAHSSSEWVVFFDDDERIAPDWLERFCDARAELDFDFIAGLYIADFEADPPSWLPERHSAAVISRHPANIAQQRIVLGSALMWGGNCAIRRVALEQVGAFSTAFARGDGLPQLGCEDIDMQFRLLRAGFTGWFDPRLKILHWTPVSKLQKSFFREKTYWAGYTLRRYEFACPDPTDRTVQLLGVARWRWRAVAASFGRVIWFTILRKEARRFESELDLRWFAGYLSAVRKEKPDLGRRSSTAGADMRSCNITAPAGGASGAPSENTPSAYADQPSAPHRCASRCRTATPRDPATHESSP